MKKEYIKPSVCIHNLKASAHLLAGSGVGPDPNSPGGDGGALGKRGWFDEYDEPSGGMNLWEGLEDRLDDGI